MSLEIKVGPPQLAIHQGHAVLLTEPDGQISWPSEKGLYFYDTRVISSWNVYANGEPCSRSLDRRVESMSCGSRMRRTDSGRVSMPRRGSWRPR
jgi:hypothetical protein